MWPSETFTEELLSKCWVSLQFVLWIHTERVEDVESFILTDAVVYVLPFTNMENSQEVLNVDSTSLTLHQDHCEHGVKLLYGSFKYWNTPQSFFFFFPSRLIPPCANQLSQETSGKKWNLYLHLLCKPVFSAQVCLVFWDTPIPKLTKMDQHLLHSW